MSQRGTGWPWAMKYALPVTGEPDLEPLAGQHVGERGIVDVGQVDERIAAADPEETCALART